MNMNIQNIVETAQRADQAFQELAAALRALAILANDGPHPARKGQGEGVE